MTHISQSAAECARSRDRPKTFEKTRTLLTGHTHAVRFRDEAFASLLSQMGLLNEISEFPKFYFPSDPNQFYIPRHPGPTRQGRFAIVTNVGQGMRWTRAALLTRALICGRRSRVVLTPRRWRQASQKCLRGDGGKQARSPGRARNKLLKPSRAGMPGDPGATVVTTSCAFYLCTRDCGCNGHPAFPAPSLG